MSAPKFDEGRLMQLLVAPIVSEKATSAASPAAGSFGTMPAIRLVALVPTLTSPAVPENCTTLYWLDASVEVASRPG